MRVALLDADPRISGASTYIYEMKKGFEKLGHEATVITISKSGKQSVRFSDERIAAGDKTFYAMKGIQWSAYAPDVVLHQYEAAEALNAFDLIWVPEPMVPGQDRKAFDTFDEPMYLVALRETKTPWATHIHGPHYATVHGGNAHNAPFLEDLFNLPNFKGFTATRPWHVDEEPRLQPYKHKSLVTGVIPYTPRVEVDDDYPRDEMIGMIGRVVPNKGVAHMLAGLQTLPASWGMSLHGACSVAMGPCYTWKLFEELTAKGWVGDLHMPEDERARIEAKGMRPVLKPYPFTMTYAQRVARYGGGYGSFLRGGYGVHCGFTYPTFQHEILEYSVLEALDDGKLAVLMPHYKSECTEPFAVSWIDTPWEMPTSKDEDYGGRSVKMTSVSTGQLEAMRRAFNSVLAVRNDPDLWRATVRANRKLLRHVHDPANHARLTIQLLDNGGPK